MNLPRARTDGLLVKELPDETLVYELTSHQAHCLNRPTALVWRCCDGKTNVAEMAIILRGELGIPTDEHYVELALDELAKANLLVQAETPRPRPYSRREAMSKMGVAALLLPVVMTITAPKASAGTSTALVQLGDIGGVAGPRAQPNFAAELDQQLFGSSEE